MSIHVYENMYSLQNIKKMKQSSFETRPLKMVLITDAKSAIETLRESGIRT